MLNLETGIPPVKMLSMVGAEAMRRSFGRYIRSAWPQVEPAKLAWNWHIDCVADHLMALSMREIRFLMIMLPPRMSKSLVATVLWPTWHWTNWPEEQFICASYSADLSLEHSLMARRVIESSWYQERWGTKFYMRHDENRADMYRNSAGGYRLTTSVKGRSTGEGGSIQLIDDPHDAKNVESDVMRASTLAWHDNAWRSRVNDPNTARKLYVAQRTHDSDVMGHVLSREGDRWCQLILPMEFDVKRKCITYANDGTGQNIKKKLFEDPRKVEGELLNPIRFNKETARAEKEGGMSDRAWNAQYQQQPEGQGGLILKRAWWRPWVYETGPETGKEKEMPVFFEIIQVYDTALEANEENDFTARTTWGIFEHEDVFIDPKSGKEITGEKRVCAMLLDMLCDRLEYPELRDEMIRSHNKLDPDWILIEKKVSGHSLIHEGRRKSLPMKAVKVHGDLQSRVNEASLMLKKGCIWYVPRTWSFQVINSAAKFPVGDHDDIESTLAIAWQYMRQWHGLQLPDDETQQEIDPFRWKRKTYA